MEITAANYLELKGWMITDLHLKGNDLLVYACIYGFSQAKGQCYYSSLQYLQDWTCSTRQGVTNSLNSLVDKGYLIKEAHRPTNRYYVNPEYVPILTRYQVSESSEGATKSEELAKSPKAAKNAELMEKVNEIMQFFNDTCKCNYKSTSNSTINLISARLKEGFSVQDFKTVIQYKYLNWGINPVKFSNGKYSDEYLKPSTLFASKNFEDYLQQANTEYERYLNSEAETQPVVIKPTLLPEDADLTF